MAGAYGRASLYGIAFSFSDPRSSLVWWRAGLRSHLDGNSFDRGSAEKEELLPYEPLPASGDGHRQGATRSVARIPGLPKLNCRRGATVGKAPAMAIPDPEMTEKDS